MCDAPAWLNWDWLGVAQSFVAAVVFYLGVQCIWWCTKLKKSRGGKAAWTHQDSAGDEIIFCSDDDGDD